MAHATPPLHGAHFSVSESGVPVWTDIAAGPPALSNPKSVGGTDAEESVAVTRFELDVCCRMLDNDRPLLLL